jgi:hypothetical protein
MTAPPPTAGPTPATATAPPPPSAPAGPVPRVRKEETVEEKPTNYAGAVMAGLIAAIVAAFVWYGFVVLTKIQFGLIAVGVGFLVAFAVVIGSGGGHGVGLQLIAIGMVLVSMIFSEFLIARYFINQLLAQAGGGEVIPIFASLGTIFDIAFLSLKEDPISLLFWGIAVFEAWKIPKED